MPRQLRLELAGGHYHVMARGDRREPIFLNVADREDFVGLLGEVCQRHGWRVHAWVLMGNHYHLLLETPQPNLVSGMSQLQQTYTQRFNRRHRQSGHLFGGRYKAVLVEVDLEGPDQRARLERSRVRERSDYFTIVADYIHLNPVRAGLVSLGRGKGLMGYAWSSLVQAYARPTSRRARWMEVGPVLAGYEQSDTPRGRQRMMTELEGKARAEAAQKVGLRVPEGQSLQSTLRRGWYFGSQEFGERTLRLVGKVGAKLSRKGEHYEGARVARDHGEKEAERLSTLGLKEVARPGSGSARRRKRKGRAVGERLAAAAVASVVRERTSVSVAWVAQRFRFGSAGNASQQMYHCRQQATQDRALASLLARLRAL